MFRHDTLLFIVCAALFAIHQLMIRFNIHLRFADDYLDPALILPIMLYAVKVERQLLFRYSPHYRLPASHVVGYVVLTAVVGEWLFPYLNPLFVYDPVDLFCYAIGGLLYSAAANQK